MKKKATANTNLDALLNARNERLIDILAGGYLKCLAEIEDRKQQLLRVCRKEGFTPKDAPKTKMLVGELYEVLASRATRTDVDQKKVWDVRARFKARRHPETIYRFFETETIHSLREDWEQGLIARARGFSASRLRDLVTSCLRVKHSRRLTVRRKKSAKSVDKKAA